jgi:hypothetical protein
MRLRIFLMLVGFLVIISEVAYSEESPLKSISGTWAVDASGCNKEAANAVVIGNDGQHFRIGGMKCRGERFWRGATNDFRIVGKCAEDGELKNEDITFLTFGNSISVITLSTVERKYFACNAIMSGTVTSKEETNFKKNPMKSISGTWVSSVGDCKRGATNGVVIDDNGRDFTIGSVKCRADRFSLIDRGVFRIVGKCVDNDKAKDTDITFKLSEDSIYLTSENDGSGEFYACEGGKRKDKLNEENANPEWSLIIVDRDYDDKINFSERGPLSS